MIGICGDDCNFCPRYVATQNGNDAELEKTRKLWVRLGLRDSTFTAQDMACYGCKPENRCAYSELRACANNKLIENCGLCNEYPCELLNTALEASETLQQKIDSVCTPDEMEAIKKAFLSKRSNLDRIHSEMKERIR